MRQEGNGVLRVKHLRLWTLILRSMVLVFAALHLIALPLLAAETAPESASNSASWALFKPENMGFSVRMPPVNDPVVKETAHGVSKLWGSVENDTRYVVSVYTYSADTKALYDPDFFMQNMIAGFLDKRSGGVTKDVKINGVTGREVVFDAGDDNQPAQRAVFFVTPQSGFIFAASSTNGKVKPVDDQFFQSISIEDSSPFVPWKSLQRADLALEVSIPTANKEVDLPTDFGTAKGWLGLVKGVQYMVVAQKLDKEIPSSAFAQTLSGLAAGFFSGKEYKLLRDFKFQGLDAQEYSFVEPQSEGAERVGKAIACVSNKHLYMFIAGGEQKQLDREAPAFFGSIKLGDGAIK